MNASTSWLTIAQIAERGTLAEASTTVYVVADNGSKLQVERVERGDKGWYSAFIVGDTTGEPLKRRAGFLLAVEVAAMDSTEDKLMERVRKLFETADPANNATDNEREQAYTIAMKLVAKHNLDLRAVRGAGISDDIGQQVFNVWENNKFELKGYRFIVMQAVAKLALVRVFTVGKDRAMWVGTSANMTIAAYMYHSVCNQIKAAADPAAKAASARGEIAVGHGSKGKDPYAWRKQFMEGAAARVLERVNAMVAQQQAAAADLKAIVLAVNSDTDKWISDNMKVGKAKGKVNSISGAGVDAGYSAGENINLNTGIEADEQGGDTPLLG